MTDYRQLAAPADALDDVTLEWDSALGPGGATLARLADAPRPAPAATEEISREPAPFSRLTGVHFPADSQEIIFFGEDDPAYPPLVTADLLDAFILACRAQREGVAPGMSIDPQPNQLARGLQAGDLMNVVFFGGTEGAEFGEVAFECDRLMKCLSFGIDNLTNNPLTSNVPGYRDELDLLLAQQGKRAQSWHRFWIEHASSRIEHSEDGRTFLLDVKLAINTQYMVVQGGKLVPGKDTADPAAQTFSQHMTDHYFDFAREFPVFARLHAYAALTSLAQALVVPAATADDKATADDAPSGDAPPPPPSGLAVRPELNWQWIFDEHQVRRVTETKTTPAIVAVREKLQADQVTRTRIQLTGGVTLQPRNRYHRESAVAAIGGAVAAARQTATHPGRFTVSVGGRTYQAAATRPARSRRFWQEDLRAGKLAVVRDFAESSQEGDLGRDWTLRRPRVTVSSRTVEYTDAGKVPQSVAIRDGLGPTRVLDKFGQIGEGGQPPTAAYTTADGRQRLLMYTNTWLYLDGDVQFFQSGDGQRIVKFGPGARMIHFAPDEGHAVREVRAADGETHYSYEQGRLAAIFNPAGDRLRFVYDDQGRPQRIETSQGQSVAYRFDRQGRLRDVVNERNQFLSYTYEPQSGTPTAIRGSLTRQTIRDLPPAAQLSLQAVVTPSTPAARARRSDRAAIVSLQPAQREPSGFLLTVDGRPLPVPNDFPLLVERAVIDGDAAAQKQLRQLFLADAILANRSVLVLEGESELAQGLARALRDDSGTVRVFAASDASRAIRHLGAPAVSRQPPQVLVFQDGLLDIVRTQLPTQPATDTESNTVIIVGHHSAEFVQYLRDLGNQGALRGKNVVLVSCGKAGQGRTHAGLTDALLDDTGAGAVSFVGFHDVIRQQALPVVVSRLREALARTGAEAPRAPEGSPGGPAADSTSPRQRSDDSLEHVLRQVLDQLRSELDAGKDLGNFQADDIQAMQELLYEKIGRVPARSPCLPGGPRRLAS